MLHFLLTCFGSLNFFVWTIEHNEEHFSGVAEGDGPDSQSLKLVKNDHLCNS